jgi:uncharacterized membrane protein YdjX (TVP38/TMEM64 family)
MERLRNVAWIPILRALAVVALVLGVAAAIAWFPAGHQIIAWVEAVRRMGARGLVVFAIAYCFGTVLLVPASPFPVAAGFLWGPWVGFAVSWFGEMAGALIAYALGRSVLRARVKDALQRWPVFAALDTALDEQGLLLLLLVRLSPVFPFGPLNYALGVSGVRPVPYLVATGLGVVPLCLVAAWAGSALPHLEAVIAGEETLGYGALPYWGGLATTVLAVIAVTRATRRALAKRIGREPVA